MINEEFKALGRKCGVLPNFGICCRELGGSKLRVFVHACAVSALSHVIHFDVHGKLFPLLLREML